MRALGSAVGVTLAVWSGVGSAVEAAVASLLAIAAASWASAIALFEGREVVANPLATGLSWVFFFFAICWSCGDDETIEVGQR